MKNKRCDSFTAHGLHIHRALGIVYVEVVLSKGIMTINEIHLFNGVLMYVFLLMMLGDVWHVCKMMHVTMMMSVWR